MKKLALDVDALHVESYETGTVESHGTVVANAITLDVVACTTKNHGCPITWGCPYTTP
jgi:hypothetical protein